MLYQDDTFEVAGLAGTIVEQLLGFTDRERDDQPDKVFLKLYGEPWQSFFLDAGLGFWEAWDEPGEDPFDGYEDSRQIDYGNRFGLVGATLLEARCDIVEPRETTCITLKLDRGILRFSYAWPNDLDGDVVLTFEPRSEE